MASTFIKLPPSSGGSGAVDSVNGFTGNVVLGKADIGLGNVDNTSDANKPISTATQTALDLKQDEITGPGNRIIRKASDNTVSSDENLQSYDDGELAHTPNFDIEDGVGKTSTQISPIFTTIEAAPSTTVNTLYISPTIADTGFPLGRNGTAINVLSTNVNHNNETDIGSINLLSQNFNLGNGTDPVAVKGIGYVFGFGTVGANVTVDGPIQGYGFQPNLDASSTMTSYMTAFYDGANVNTKVNGYTSVNLSPQISEIQNNNNVTIININPTIDSFEGNAGANGLAISGTYEGFGTSGVNFITVNPTAGDATAKYATGIFVSMDNVVGYPGVQSTLTVQDLTFTWTLPGDNNSYTMEYTPGATAGSEVVTISGNAIEVQIESGVSTATQIKTALDGNAAFNSNIDITISGVGSDPQVTFGPTNFVNGENIGNVKAASFDGDVEITGSLSFGGALSVGKLAAFGTQVLSDGGGNPQSIHSLVTQPTIGDNLTVANADILGVNTAMLLNIGANSTVTTSFVGLAALGLPAVITMGAGSTLDRASGATFALSLDAGAGGGTIDTLDLCRALAIPNGATAVTKLTGYKMDLPFGDPGTTSWGFYESPGVNNYFAGNLLIGGTAGSDDTVTNASVGLEMKSTNKAFVPSRMNTTQRDALTAIEGMIIFNTSTSKLQVYASGSWVDLH